jgi:hypothetical protein
MIFLLGNDMKKGVSIMVIDGNLMIIIMEIGKMINSMDKEKFMLKVIVFMMEPSRTVNPQQVGLDMSIPTSNRKKKREEKKKSESQVIALFIAL